MSADLSSTCGFVLSICMRAVVGSICGFVISTCMCGAVSSICGLVLSMCMCPIVTYTCGFFHRCGHGGIDQRTRRQFPGGNSRGSLHDVDSVDFNK